MEELKEFFNAMELDKLLEILVNSLQEENYKNTENIKEICQKFIKEKENSHARPLNCIKDLTAIRENLIELKKGGLSDSIFGYAWNADFQLEDYLFVIVGEFLNYSQQNLRSDEDLDQFLQVALLILQNMKYSDYEREECECIENAINNFIKLPKDDSIYYLRIKAVIDRALRLIRHLSNTIYNAYQSTMSALGKALEVDYRAIAVYSEAIIRSNIIFHLSNILERADNFICQKLNLPPFVVISAGNTNGNVKFAASCEAIFQENNSPKSKGKLDGKPLIAFIDEVQGDEEFPEKIKGLILQREIPLLSHLAIRIRQSGAVCCACKNTTFYNKLKANIKSDQQIQLIVNNEKVEIKPAQMHQPASLVKKSEEILTSIEHSPVDFSVRFLITSAAEAQKMSFCIGTKSTNAFVLETISEKAGKFKTPVSGSLPYGAFGGVLTMKCTGEEDTSSLSVNSIFGQLDICDDARMMEKLHSALLERINIKLEQELSRKVVDQYASQIKELFTKKGTKLIAIRSSSNMEDLKKLSGAGLFDSILNIPAGDESQISDAIKTVWKSLYSRRAVQSRIKYRLKQEIAAMAILIQEMIPSDYSFIMHTTNPVFAYNFICL